MFELKTVPPSICGLKKDLWENAEELARAMTL
jgi:hypothetical protein